MWKGLVHPNVVHFIGVTFSPLQIVSEWMPGGDLTSYIKLKPDTNRIALVSPSFPLSRKTTLLFLQLVDVADGLHYLHSCNVIHGDLKGVIFSSSPIFIVSLIDPCSRISWWTLPAMHV